MTHQQMNMTLCLSCYSTYSILFKSSHGLSLWVRLWLDGSGREHVVTSVGLQWRLER